MLLKSTFYHALAPEDRFTLQWDEAFAFDRIETMSLPGLSAESFGMQRVQEGLLTTVWSHPQGIGETLEEGDLLDMAMIAAASSAETVTVPSTKSR